MNRTQLEYFIEVYERKSCKKTAEYLMISQQGVSKMIKMIEEAAANDAKLVAFGECVVPGYMYHVWTEFMWDAHAKYDLLLMNRFIFLHGQEIIL